MTTPSNLNPQGPVPLYIQLRDLLLRLIRQGKFKPHDQLPSERELGEEYGISRMTVRQAVQALVHDGIIYTRVGKGTFVGDLRFEQDHTLSGFSEEMQSLGKTTSSRVLEAATIPATAELAGILQVHPNSSVICLVRLRIANGHIIAHEKAYLPHSMVPNLLDHDFSVESLYAVMHQEYGLKLVTAEQTVVAALANRQEVRMLQLKSPAAVLRMKRITRTDQGEVAEYTESLYLGERYELKITLSKKSR
ncbi:MAG TPA: GntR family transcriptional regulator [Sedimentisphaerales bacterium]|nr:GntR family transcriptional regulator [Sedimentisphaerales bacterium]